MKKFTKIKGLSILLSVFYIVFGIILIAMPEATKLAACYAFGGILAFAGVVEIINYFLYGYEPFGFIKGISSVLLGILFLCLAPWLSSGYVFSFIFGLIFILENLFKIQDSLDYRRFGVKTWWIDLVCALIMLAFGIVLVVNPFGAERWLIIYLGIGIILEGIIGLIVTFIVSSKAKKVRRSIKQAFGPIDAEYIIKEEPDEKIEK